jgi:hypothetical protein
VGEMLGRNPQESISPHRRVGLASRICLSLQMTNRLRIRIKPLPPVLTLRRRLQSVDHAAVGGKPGIPIVGQRFGASLQIAVGERNAAFVGGADGPALGHTVGTFALVATIHINPEGGSVGLNGTGWAGGLATLAANAVTGDGVGHGSVLGSKVIDRRRQEAGGAGGRRWSRRSGIQRITRFPAPCLPHSLGFQHLLVVELAGNGFNHVVGFDDL